MNGYFDTARKIILLGVIGVTGGFGMFPKAYAGDFTVKTEATADLKAVFATVETTDQVGARARIGGTIISLSVREGDMVEAGQEIALIGDDKLAIQIKTIDAQISGIEATRSKALNDYKRAEKLVAGQALSRSAFDTTKAAYINADNQYKALKSQKEVIEQQVTEGKILAPTKGRILQVPVTIGSVIMPGESVATLGAESYILRLQLPERHARHIKAGDPVQMDDSRNGQIILVYPGIENGRVIADAQVDGLENYFVGERVRVWVSTGTRQAIYIPEDLITTRSGIDYVMLKQQDGQPLEIPVQRGRVKMDNPAVTEILSGLHDGDILIQPAGEQ